MSLGTIASLAAQSNTHPIILLIDIVSVEDGAALHLSQLPCTFGGSSYLPHITGVSGFEQDLSSSSIGIMGISDITITLGDADGTYTSWDNAHFFKGAKLTATLLFLNEATGTPASSDSQVIFKGICNAPDSVSPLSMTISAYNRFNATFLLIPTSRISQFSQTVFPGTGAQDCDDANANGPANPSSAGYQYWAPGGAATDVIPYLPYGDCGYGPMRGVGGFGGSNPLGNFLVAATAANIFSSTTIGNSGLGATSGALVNHIVIISSGTGVGQERRIQANTSTTITVANPFTVTPDATSHFVVLYAFCSNTPEDCQARGMFAQDSSGRNCFRYRGITFVPTDWRYESPNGHHQNTTSDPNFAKYNDVIPLVYGTARVIGKIMFTQTANDTRGQAIICEGPIAAMGTDTGTGNTMIIGGEIIPYDPTYPHVDTVTGKWKYGLGTVGQNYQDVFFPNSDTYSKIAVVSFNFPPQFAQNSSSFSVSVLVQGLMMPTYGAGGLVAIASTFTDNPAWIILDVLRRSGWQLSEINVPSFYAFSVYAEQQIAANVSSSCTSLRNRFRLSAVISEQQPVADVISSFLGNCRGILSYDNAGLLRLDCENRQCNTTLAANVTAGAGHIATVEDGAGITIGSQLVIDSGANQETVTVQTVQLAANDFQFEANFAKNHSTGATVVIPPAFAFDLSSIAQNSDGTPKLVRTSLKTAATPNDYTVEFQNSARQYVQDSAQLLSVAEANNFGAKVVGQLNADGFEDVDSAVRAERLELYKGHGRRSSANKILSRGNMFAQLESSVKAIGATIGSLVSVTYPKEGWVNKLFRVVHLSPTPDQQFPYWNMGFTLREHDDAWYDDVNGNIEPTPGAIPNSPNPTPPLPKPPRPHFPILA